MTDDIAPAASLDDLRALREKFAQQYADLRSAIAQAEADEQTSAQSQTASERAAAIGGLVAKLYNIVAERHAQMWCAPNAYSFARDTLPLVEQAIVAHDDVSGDDVLVEMIAKGVRAAVDEVAQRQTRQLVAVRAMLDNRARVLRTAWVAAKDADAEERAARFRTRLQTVEDIRVDFDEIVAN